MIFMRVSDQLWHRLIQLGEYITLWGEREQVQPSAMQNIEYLHAHDTNRNMTISLRHVHQSTLVPTCVPHKLWSTTPHTQNSVRQQ